MDFEQPNRQVVEEQENRLENFEAMDVPQPGLITVLRIAQDEVEVPAGETGDGQGKRLPDEPKSLHELLLGHLVSFLSLDAHEVEHDQDWRADQGHDEMGVHSFVQKEQNSRSMVHMELGDGLCMEN